MVVPDMSSAIEDNTKLTNYPCAGPSKLLYFITFLSSISGFLFGYDTGIISGALLLIKKHFLLNSIWQEVVVSVTIASAWCFSLAASVINERFGRKICILLCSLWFAIGSIIMALSDEIELLILGRFIVGAAVGLSSAAVPLYIAEVATSSMRGKLVTMNNCLITGGQFLSTINAGLFSTVPEGWRYMLGLAAIPALIQGVGFIFCPESPRWLMRHGKVDKALTALAKLRADQSLVKEEFEVIRSHCEKPESVNDRQTESIWTILRRDRAVRRALLVGCALQLIQQFAGINTIMYYSASIIQMAGVKDESQAIWLSSLTGLTNFLFTFVGFYFVERLGRRKLTLTSLFGVCISLFLLSGSFYMSQINLPPVVVVDHSSAICSTFSSCGDCVANPACGFCYSPSSDFNRLNGSCVASLAPDHHNSLNGSCVKPDGSHIFAYDWCPTKFAWLIILGLIVYLICFASGIGPMAWTINAEIYPMKCRSACFAISTSFNWLSNLLVSLTFLSLIEGIGEVYTFLLYMGITLIGFIYFFIYLPETRGRSLEDIEKLFRCDSDRNPVFQSEYGTNSCEIKE